MHRLIATVALAAMTIVTLPVFADARASKEHAGRKGYVSAYDADETTVMDVQSCDIKKMAHDYVECGKNLRDRVKSEICDKKGKGKHTWFYQVGDGTKGKQTTVCK